ncbi:MAG: Maf family protein [Aquificaceae bacterium]|uniref:Maf family protein n=1 Tax=Hydrogenobacter sp. Uz 6-8 TaxID=3384828 RepID=UPI000F146849|nr:MAG: septum formation protein Maf [Aquificota bacterium]
MRLLILASESKRRVQILSMLGFKFLVIPSYVEESHQGRPILTARRLAFKKAFTVWKDYKFATVLGADTLVVLGNRIMGKPRDREEARQMLVNLSGRWHRVITGVCIISPRKRVSFHDTAWVKFRQMGREEIEEYISTDEPMDKAGAYAVQGMGARFVEKIVGDFYTVMGLPASRTYRVLKDVLD